MIPGGIVFEAGINSMVRISNIFTNYRNLYMLLQVVQLTALPDDVPELNETYYVQLTEVTGGGRLASDNTVANVTILANQNPYGVFELFAEGM